MLMPPDNHPQTFDVFAVPCLLPAPATPRAPGSHACHGQLTMLVSQPVRKSR